MPPTVSRTNSGEAIDKVYCRDIWKFYGINSMRFFMAPETKQPNLGVAGQPSSFHYRVDTSSWITICLAITQIVRDSVYSYDSTELYPSKNLRYNTWATLFQTLTWHEPWNTDRFYHGIPIVILQWLGSMSSPLKNPQKTSGPNWSQSSLL